MALKIMEISEKDLAKMVDILTDIQLTAFNVFQDLLPAIMGMPKIQSNCEKLKVIIHKYLNH